MCMQQLAMKQAGKVLWPSGGLASGDQTNFAHALLQVVYILDHIRTHATVRWTCYQ